MTHRTDYSCIQVELAEREDLSVTKSVASCGKVNSCGATNSFSPSSHKTFPSMTVASASVHQNPITAWGIRN